MDGVGRGGGVVKGEKNSSVCDGSNEKVRNLVCWLGLFRSFLGDQGT